MVLQSPLLARAGFLHGFSTRNYDLSLPNAALHAELARLGRDAGFDARLLRSAKQVHGRRVFDGSRAHADKPSGAELQSATPNLEADAVFVRHPHLAAVRVADCVSVLVGDTKTGTAAAIHAGWRGIVEGVVAATFLHWAASHKTTLATLGPCIGPCCFEVDAEIGETIASAVQDRGVVRAEHAPKKVRVDLRRAVKAQLLAEGLRVEQIDEIEGCTRCDRERFFSFRRDGAASGRHLAFIAAKSR